MRHTRSVCALSVLALSACSDKSTKSVSPDAGMPSMTDSGLAMDANMGGEGGEDLVDGSYEMPPRPDLPAAPDWDPPFPVTGEEGWRDSKDPLCNQDTGTVQAYSGWADDKGVYSLVSIQNNPLSGSAAGERPSGIALHFNDGKGWQELWFRAAFTNERGVDPRMMGSAGGPLMLGPWGCGVELFSDGELSCSLPQDDIRDQFVVDATRAYALTGQGLSSFDGKTWTSAADFPKAFNPGEGPLALWADAQGAVAMGLNQTAFRYDVQTGIAPMTGVPAGDYTALWGTAANDLWAGNYANELLHYDGAKWTKVPADIKDCGSQGIQGIWGHDGIVYFYTNHVFARYDGKTVEKIIDLDCELQAPIRSMWGSLDGKEIYLAVTDSKYVNYACGSTFLVWYDGAAFHRF